MLNSTVPQEVHEESIRALSRGASREDLILSICERTPLRWPEAEAFINNLEAEHGFEIESRATPFLTALGGLIILAGLALLAVAMTGVFLGLQNIFSGFETDGVINIAGYLMEGTQFMRISLLILPLALGMIIGGGMGLYRRIVPK
jgi:hypothetical protein